MELDKGLNPYKEDDIDFGDFDSPKRGKSIKSTNSKKQFGPQPTLGRVIKMSTRMWSQNERLLKVDDLCLQYYSKVPADFNREKMESFEMS